jgi:predicted DCC family thiol-disulfide oxidoreductase YuxK
LPIENPPISFSKAYLLYDSRCGPCTDFMKLAKVLDLHRRLTPISIHGRQAEILVAGVISPTRLKNSFHVVEVRDGIAEVFSAGDGLIRLTRYAPGGKITFAAVSRIKSIRQALRWSYFQMTRIRSASKTCSVN